MVFTLLIAQSCCGVFLLTCYINCGLSKRSGHQHHLPLFVIVCVQNLHSRSLHEADSFTMATRWISVNLLIHLLQIDLRF